MSNPLPDEVLESLSMLDSVEWSWDLGQFPISTFSAFSQAPKGQTKIFLAELDGTVVVSGEDFSFNQSIELKAEINPHSSRLYE